jgi:hypothetical protein
MQKRNWKKIVLTSGAVLLGLAIILAVHIYWVTRPHIDASTRVMARIDLHQSITQDDAAKISGWLYQQKGVDHVLVSPASQIALFTFAPVKNDANRIVEKFKTNTPYIKAERFLPKTDPNASGCPVATTSFTYKVYGLMKRVI